MTEGAAVRARAEERVGRRRSRTERRKTTHRAALAMLVVGLVLTGVLAAAAWSAYDSNEDRLLGQRTSEAAAVLRSAISALETPLSSATALVAATEADQRTFVGFMSVLVGEDRRFASASVWALDDLARGPLILVGDEPELAGRPVGEVREFFDRPVEAPSLTVLDLLDASPPRLGFSYAVPTDHDYAVYVEQLLPEDRTSTQQPDAAFSDLDYALYVGSERVREQLVFASTADIPLDGRLATEQLMLGDADLLLVMSPMRNLGGDLLRYLPWVILGAGTLISFGFAGLNERALRRRDQAEELVQELARVAEDNARLYSEQRSVAQALQQSLLLESLPDLPGIELAVRYEPGVDGVDIGGDWYDVIPREGGRVLVVVGDVSGRGVQAATVMAALRHSIHAYAVQGDAPATILAKLGRLVSVDKDGHFATVLLAEVDPVTGSVTMANAGHPSPLVVDRSMVAFAESVVGVPVGVRQATYTDVTMALPPGATLLAFTDGLFERRGETVDAGLERLRSWVEGADGDLEAMLDGIVDEFAGTADDDAAILAVRWLPRTNPPS